MQINLQDGIEHKALQESLCEERAKLAYQDFYKANKHAFCLGSWEQLTEKEREHYRKKVNEKINLEFKQILSYLNPLSIW